MNLIDPHTITAEVLRRAVDLYCASVLPAHCPFVWSDDLNDMGVDGRFNLSAMGRFIEESILLDAVAHLKPSSDLPRIEALVRRHLAVVRPPPEAERFVVALGTALGEDEAQIEALILSIRRRVNDEAAIPPRRKEPA